MKKSLRLLFTMLLALVGINASWAWDAEKTYTLRAAGTELYATTTEGADNSWTTYTFSTTPEEFKIVGNETEGWTIQSASTDKYIGVSSSVFWDCGNNPSKCDITEVGAGTYHIYRSGLNNGLGWDNLADGSNYYTNKTSNNTLTIEEAGQKIGDLTLSFVFNESKTVATVTVEGLTGGSIAAWYEGDDFDEPMGTFSPAEGNTFDVAPLTFPSTMVISVREYDDDLNLLAQGAITISFPVSFSVDPSKVYTLRTARVYMPAGEDKTELWANGNYLVAVNSADEAGKFRIEGEEDAYTLYNVELQKYISANEGYAYAEEADGTFTILNAAEVNGNGEAWIIKSNVTGKWLMFGGSKEFTNNSNWKTADDGDQWFIEETTLPEPVIEPLYTTVGTTSVDEEWESDNQTAHLVEGELAVEAYDGYVIIRAFDGVEGYDLKVAFDEDQNVTSAVILHNGEESDPTANWASSGKSNWYVYTDEGYAYADSDPETQSGYVFLSAYVGSVSNYVYYNVSWGEEEEEEVAELLYSVKSAVAPHYLELIGEETDFPAINEVTVDVYDKYVYVNAWAGVEGYDLKLYTNDERTVATKVVPVVNDIEGEPVTWFGTLPTGLDEQPTLDVIVSFKENEEDDDWFISEMSISEEAGSISLLFDNGFNGYYLAWPATNEQPGDEVLYSLVGKVQDMPNAYVSELLGLEEGENIISMSDPNNNVNVDVYADYFIIRNFMNAEGVDLQCWYQVDDTDEDDIQTLVYKYQIVGQEIDIENIPGEVSGTYIEVNKEGYDLMMGMCSLNPMSGWLTIIATKMSDKENFYHYSLDFSDAVVVERPAIDPAEGEVVSLQVFTLTFDQEITIDDSEDSWWYDPVLVDDNYNGYFGVVTMGENANQAIITLYDAVTRGGNYTLTVNAAKFGLGDAQWTYSYTIAGGGEVDPELEELDETTVVMDPANGSTVESLEKFTITFTNTVMDVQPLDDFSYPVLKNADGDVIATAWNGLECKYDAAWNIESVSINFEFDDETAYARSAKAPKRATILKGEYTLEVPIKVTYDWATWAGATLVYNYTLANDIETGVSSVKATEGAAVFNLNGQRVSKAQKGLYIINGTKTVVK